MSNVTSRISLLLFGTPEFASRAFLPLFEDQRYSILAAVTQPDKPAGRGRKLVAPPVKQLALSHNIPVFQPSRLRRTAQDFLQSLTAFPRPDFGVVVAFGQILPQEVLDYPKFGCINVHASLLPRWRGAAPIQRAIMAGDKETGICLMQMDAGLDTGAVYYEEKIGIDEDDTAGTLHDKLAHLGGELLQKNLALIVSGSLQARPQESSGVTYAEKITNDEAQVNFSLPVKEVCNRIRGLSPFPGAHTTLQGRRLKIFFAQPTRLFSSSGSDFRPGEIVYIDTEHLHVACRDGALEIRELQLEGKRKMSIREFLKGFSLKAGMRLADDTAQ